jgi:hypothetical protein
LYRFGPNPRAVAGPVLVLVALALVSAALSPARGEEAGLIPDYRILGAMLHSAAGGSPLSSLGTSMEVIGPTLVSLGRDHGVNLREQIQAGIVAQDRRQVIRVIVLTALLEAGDEGKAIEHDRLTGWGSAKRHATLSFLTYMAVVGILKVDYPKPHGRVAAAYTRLVGLLKQSDLTTPPAAIEGARDALLSDLAELTAAVRGAGPAARGEQP